jgi:uncharacterized protein
MNLAPRAPRDNTDAEIEAFTIVCERMGGFSDRIWPEWADGYLTALAAGPRALAFDEWLPAMAGDAFERAFADPADRAMAEAALKARAAVLADQLDAEALFDDPDRLRLSPLMSDWDEAARAEAVEQGGMTADEAAELVTGGQWADGFFAALEDVAADWTATPDDDEAALFTELLAQVQALRLAEGSDALREHVRATYDEAGAGRERLVDEACYAVQDLRLWWVDHAPRPATRRVAKTPGRNDPCPCGSGLKFKKCHGAAPG